MERTPIYDEHLQLGAKMVNFGGWEMPVQYPTGIVAEHQAVRNSCGIFDVSHMGEIRVTGKDAGKWLDYLLTNTISTSAVERVVYSPMCQPDGGTVDDLLIYHLSEDEYLCVVNAGNITKDWNWMNEQLDPELDVELSNESDDIGLVAVQGPRAETILSELTTEDLSAIKYFRCRNHVTVAGVDCLISRTGYTGEDGFELYCPAEDVAALWRLTITQGGERITPAGLGARDSLRLEAGLCLYGNDLSEKISPVMANLDHFIKFDKEQFIGKDALLAQTQDPSTPRLAGLICQRRAIARHGYEIRIDGEPIGTVTSGGFAPSLGESIALGLFDPPIPEIGTSVDIMMRGKVAEHIVTEIPFYTRSR